MSSAKNAIAVIAAVVALVALFFFKPAAHYFVSICVSTIVVWSAAFAVKRFKTIALIAAAIFQLAFQQVAYRLWQAELSSVWWPLAQFVALQYIIFLTIASRDLPSLAHRSNPTPLT
ncbi:MAG TPA: hypothetical protein VF773_11735 [Verrucomicrobiae bacterium]